MIEIICEHLKDKIILLPYSDKVAGIVKEAIKREEYKDHETGEVYKIEDVVFPVAQNVTGANCHAGQYKDLAPDSSKKTVIYFERLGGDVPRKITLGNGYGLDQMATKFRMVVWLNLQKLGLNDDMGASNTLLYKMRNQLSFLCTDLRKIEVDTNEEKKVTIELDSINHDATIFTKYSYDKNLVNNMLLYPYSYFCLNFTATWYMSKCDVFLPEPPNC